jgi:hypothetical protein
MLKVCGDTDSGSRVHGEPAAMVDGGPQASAENRQEALRLDGHQYSMDALKAEEREDLRECEGAENSRPNVGGD